MRRITRDNAINAVNGVEDIVIAQVIATSGFINFDEVPAGTQLRTSPSELNPPWRIRWSDALRETTSSKLLAR
jgi:hypothetical protein